MKWSALKMALIAVISLSQILLLTFFLFYKNLNIVLGSWSESSSLVVYLKTDASDEEKNTLIQQLKSFPQAREVTLVSRQQAAEDFQKSIGSYAAGLLNEDEILDLIPETIELTLKKDLTVPEKIAVFEQASLSLKSHPFVEESLFGSSWLKRFSKIDRFIQMIGLGSFLILLLTISFLSALMVRVLIDDSKSEIEVFNLLGATSWSIHKIFLKDLLVTIVISLGLTFAASYGLFQFFKMAIEQNQLNHFLTDQLSYLSLREAGLFALAVLFFIFISSLTAISSSLKKLTQLTYD